MERHTLLCSDKTPERESSSKKLNKIKIPEKKNEGDANRVQLLIIIKLQEHLVHAENDKL